MPETFKFRVYSTERSHDQEYKADASGSAIPPWQYAATAFLIVNGGPTVTRYFPDEIIATMERLRAAMSVVDAFGLMCYFSWEVEWDHIDFYLVFEEEQVKDAIVYRLATSDERRQ